MELENLSLYFSKSNLSIIEAHLEVFHYSSHLIMITLIFSDVNM